MPPASPTPSQFLRKTRPHIRAAAGEGDLWRAGGHAATRNLPITGSPMIRRSSRAIPSSTARF